MTIDWWTLGLQTVNVVVLVWLLERFFWRPVAAMIELRRATSARSLADAEAKRTEAVAALAEIDRTRAGFAEEREAILLAAHEDAEQARAARLKEAAAEAAALQTAARAGMEKEKERTDKAWFDRASDLAVEIAGRLASRLDGPVVRRIFLDWLIDALNDLPEPTRQAMTANGVVLEAVSAAAIEPAEQELYRTRIADILGVMPQITFKSDATLIAGLELHGPHLSISNSWRADLDQILADLKHEG